MLRDFSFLFCPFISHMLSFFLRKFNPLPVRRALTMTVCLGLFAFATSSASADETLEVSATQKQVLTQPSIVSLLATDVVIEALHMIGVRYQWGGNTPASGMDCSGFVKYVFQHAADVTLPRKAVQMSRVGHAVPIHQLKPGDLVFFNTHNNRLTKSRAVSHVGIYIGNNQFIHSPRTGKTIRVDKLGNRYWKQRYTGAKRITRLFASV